MIFCMIKNKRFTIFWRKHDIKKSYNNNEISMFDFFQVIQLKDKF
jgi:hypothetical protein